VGGEVSCLYMSFDRANSRRYCADRKAGGKYTFSKQVFKIKNMCMNDSENGYVLQGEIHS